MTPTLENNIDSATSKFVEVFNAEIDKELAP
jgi:hypothetical protein